MLSTIFYTIIRSVVAPLIILVILNQTPLAGKPAFLLVCVVLTITNTISIVLNLLKVIPNLVLLKPKKIIQAILRVLVEILTVMTFWIYYIITYSGN